MIRVADKLGKSLTVVNLANELGGLGYKLEGSGPAMELLV
jgi:hypothetical protein